METARTICGPYDKEFKKKFRGSFSNSGNAERVKLSKVPSQTTNRFRLKSLNEHAMLPKLKQIEKIAKLQKKKPQKGNKYLDGVSDLQLYIANKLMNNQTTKQIVSQISKRSTEQFQNRKIVTDNYMQMSLSGVQNTKSFRENQGFGNQSKTDYPGGSGKWNRKMTSDQEFVNKFDEFIVKQHQNQNEKTQKKKLVHEEQLSEKEMTERLAADKEKLTKIARKMIAEHNDYSDEDEPPTRPNVYVNLEDEHPPEESKNISWIINQCKLFQKNYTKQQQKLKPKKKK